MKIDTIRSVQYTPQRRCTVGGRLNECCSTRCDCGCAADLFRLVFHGPKLLKEWQIRRTTLWQELLELRCDHLQTNSQFKKLTNLGFSVRVRSMFFPTTRTWHDDAILYVFNIFHKIVLFNSVVTVSREGAFTITNQECSDDLQDNNSQESAELSSIVVSGVSDITIGVIHKKELV